MPNWKTYESSVRLLSAIIAAHPDLKLNYDEVGKKYGGGTKYKAIWGRMAQIKENARLINEAIAHGIDPISVELADAPSRNSKEGQGSYVAVLIQSLLAQHDYSASPQFDPFTIDFDVYFKSETAKLFGGGVKYFAVWSVMAQINGHASALREAYDGGIDPFTVELNNETAARGKKKTQAVANNFGQGITASTPRGKKATPKKKVEDDAQFVDDDEEDLTTPSKKKGPLNKVNNGRITKKKGGAGASAGSSFNDNIIKDEYAAGFNTPENAYGYNPANYDIQEFAREQVEENAVYYDNDDTEA